MWLSSTRSQNVVAILTLVSSCLATGAIVSRDAPFQWNKLTPSPRLAWKTCFEIFQCSRLTVPLQYSNPSAGEAQIALLMLPSNFSREDPRYLGPVLFNPGGPGISGIDFVMNHASFFRSVVGPQYDLVGFDPRGVGETTPPLSIFKSPVEAFEFYSTYPLDLNESVSSFGRMFAQAQIFGSLAADRAQKFAESVSTPAVATDMLTITRAFGHEKVNYWGASYGTVLGATFAAMYPNHVGRIILDGVSNAHDYYAGNWTSALYDIDHVLTAYYDACVAAGPSLCAIWENTTHLVQARVDRLLNSIQLAPLPVFNDTDPTSIAFDVIDYPLARSLFINIAYNPYTVGAFAAQALVLLEQGEGLAFQAAAGGNSVDALATCDFDSSQPFVAGLLDVSSSITCGDVVSTALPTPAEARAAYANALGVSPFASELYPDAAGSCVGWSIRGKDRLNGSFVTDTSSPILLIANTLDPITPIIGARNMSAGFGNSVLLQQNSIGHTSMAASSVCTSSVIRAYFANGTLPAPGTICEVESQIFSNAPAPGALARDLRRRSPHMEPLVRRKTSTPVRRRYTAFLDV